MKGNRELYERRATSRTAGHVRSVWRAPIRLAGLNILVLLGSLSLSEGWAAASVYSTEAVRESPPPSLELVGTGRFRYLSLIKVVDGHFYLEPDVPAERALEDVAKRLELSYHISIDTDDFARVTHDGISRNVPRTEYQRLLERIERFNRLYRDVNSGDRYSVNYTPGQGTTLALNGAPLGTIEGADFAAALFSIWLGERDPMDRRFRQALLSLNER